MTENPVTRSFTLPHRRFAVGRAFDLSVGFGIAGAPRSETLRYGRVKLCVTAPCLSHIEIRRGSL